MPTRDRSSEERRRLRAMRRPRAGKPAWNKERTRELFYLYKEQGDEEARDELVMSHRNLVRYIANKYKDRGEPLEDLIQVGMLALIKAVDRFDPSRGLEFTTFATPTITGELKRHFRDKGWSIRVPRRLQELSAKVGRASDELTRELQRSPTVEELAERLEVSVDEVLEAMESSNLFSSVPLEGGSQASDDDTPSVIDRYADEDKDLAGSDDRMVIAEALAELSPREQEIMHLRFDEGLTQGEIAKRLDTSQVQVSRTLRALLKQVKAHLDAPSVEE